MANILTEWKAHRAPVFRKRKDPILRMGTCPENANGIFNPATVQNGVLHIYCREENMQRESVISCYTSRDGINVDRKVGVILKPGEEGSPDSKGCEDPRATFDADTGLVYIEYVGHNGETQVNMLAVSERPYEFKRFRKLGPMYNDGKPDKDGSPLGKTSYQVKGKNPHRMYANIRRIMEGDLWGMRVSIGNSIEGPYDDFEQYDPRAPWEGVRTGESQLIHVEGVGYIGMHHGAVKPNGHWVYSSGLDMWDESARMIASAVTPQIVPTTEYEKNGTEGKEIALCTGLEKVVIGGKEHIRAYYGAGDHYVMVAEAPLKDCINHLLSPECKVGKPRKNVFTFGTN